MSDVVAPPPMPSIMNYPSAVTLVIGVAATSLLLVVIGRFDVTGGSLAISLLVTLTFMGAVAFCLLFTVPNDEITAAVLGGLVAGFGAVMSHWLGKGQGK